MKREKIDLKLLGNETKFLKLRELNLPLGQYAITGSGALGIRNLRAIADIDIIVSVELWNTLSEQYGVIDQGGVKKIVFSGGLIEAFYEDSFYKLEKENNTPLIIDRITKAEVIDGLPFESLTHVLYYKRKMGREKDLKDILMIEHWLKTHE